MNIKRMLRQERTTNLALGTVFLGCIALVLNFKVLGIVLVGAGLSVLIVVYHQSESAFWRSQVEWWDDEEWKAWEAGHS